MKYLFELLNQINNIKLSNDIYYWFYGITPQTFGGILAAIGMVAVYKLSECNEYIRVYIERYKDWITVNQFKTTDSSNLTIDQAISHCQERIQECKKINDMTNIGKLSQHEKQLKNIKDRKNKIIKLFSMPLIVGFIIILESICLLAFNIFNFYSLLLLFLLVVYAIVKSCVNLIKIIEINL